jgi:2-dehydropantoate 2-reductase
MKVTLVGPGAIGCLFYSLLSRSKEDVWLLDKDEARAGRLKKNGLKIEGEATIKTAAPQVTASARDLADADLWIICVKSYDTKNVIKSLAPHVKSGAVVASLQNGLGNLELLVEAFGSGRVLAGVTHMGSTLLGEGSARWVGAGETVFGRIDGNLGVEMRDLRDLFSRSRVPVKLSRDINSVLWSKLVLNVGINALAALTRMKNGRLILHEPTRHLLKEAVLEAFRVAKRKRIKLVYDDPVSKAESLCDATADNVSSMLADVLSKKRTEIDYLNGAIVRYAENLGIKTPVNILLTELVKSIESNYEEQVISTT